MNIPISWTKHSLRVSEKEMELVNEVFDDYRVMISVLMLHVQTRDYVLLSRVWELNFMFSCFLFLSMNV